MDVVYFCSIHFVVIAPDNSLFWQFCLFFVLLYCWWYWWCQQGGCVLFIYCFLNYVFCLFPYFPSLLCSQGLYLLLCTTDIFLSNTFKRLLILVPPSPNSFPVASAINYHVLMVSGFCWIFSFWGWFCIYLYVFCTPLIFSWSLWRPPPLLSIHRLAVWGWQQQLSWNFLNLQVI